MDLPKTVEPEAAKPRSLPPVTMQEHQLSSDFISSNQIDLEMQQPETAEPEVAVAAKPRSLPEHQLPENIIESLCCALLLQITMLSHAQRPSALLNCLSLVCFSSVWILCASSYLNHALPNLCRFLRNQVSHTLGAMALPLLVFNSPLPLPFKLAVLALSALPFILIFLFNYFSSLNRLLFQLEQFLST